MSHLYEDASADLSFEAAPPPADNGLGSLADELAGALNSDSESETEETSFSDPFANGDPSASHTPDSTIPPPSTPSRKHTRALRNGSIAGLMSPGGAATAIPTPSEYDGSDYGDPEDLVENGLSFGLEEKMDLIERLAIRQVGLLKGEEDEADVGAFMEGLKELASQSGVETSSTRLITAHTALSSAIMHQTRTLRDLSFIQPHSLPPPETSDLLLSLLSDIPRPNMQPLAELNALHQMTLQLISQLSFLSDSLHMARQSAVAASRKLKVAKEACVDFRGELESVERARKWIEEGDWDGRCERREAASTCKEVIAGFGEVLDGWEKRLGAGAGAPVEAGA